MKKRRVSARVKFEAFLNELGLPDAKKIAGCGLEEVKEHGKLLAYYVQCYVDGERETREKCDELVDEVNRLRTQYEPVEGGTVEADAEIIEEGSE